ncbi:MAG: histidinol-phosphate transaminase [Gammaproteobacteria bacterium]|nr:histidinol-phosphate transaminase [Gammaproteobacteria bacterium]
MQNFCDLAVPGVRELKPYQPGKPIEELQREFGLREVVKLASNENPLGPSRKALAAIERGLSELARYPDGNGFILKKALCDRFGVALNQVTLGNGSNDILELVARTFVQPGQEVIFSQHAFAVYPIATQAVGGKAVIVPARDWGNDLDAMLKAISDNTRVIFIANPNNPTGTWLNETELTRFLNEVPEQVVVVLDEAYFEYAIHPAMLAHAYPDGMRLLQRYPNLIVSRTFSKAYGLAGLRVGYAVSHAEIADLLNRVRQPFNVNSLALSAAAAAALDDQAHLNDSATLNASGLQQLQAAFNDMGLEYIPTVGNFISVDMGTTAQPIYQALLKRGVIVRPVANYEMPNHLRVTIGTEKENTIFLSALREVLQ